MQPYSLMTASMRMSGEGNTGVITELRGTGWDWIIVQPYSLMTASMRMSGEGNTGVITELGGLDHCAAIQPHDSLHEDVRRGKHWSHYRASRDWIIVQPYSLMTASMRMSGEGNTGVITELRGTGSLCSHTAS